MTSALTLALAVVLAASPRPVDPPAADGALAPWLATTADGALLLSWLEPRSGGSEDGYRLRMARFDGRAWGEPATIAEDRPFLANWADVPSVTDVRSGLLYAQWLERPDPDAGGYDAIVARSTDDGETWAVIGPLHDDDTPTEHGFVSLVPEAGGVRAFWLDGREMDVEAAIEAGRAVHGIGAMTLRTALVTTHVGPDSVLDDRVCECCPTSAAITRNGAILVYRDRGDDERRDIAVLRRTTEGWSPRAHVHDDGWTIRACPVNGPAVAARGSDVAVAWFTGADGRPRVSVAFSSDAGATFETSVELDADAPVGRVDCALDAEGDAIVTWLGGGAEAGALHLRRLHRDGRESAPVTVAVPGGGRPVGMPRVAMIDERLALVVWTEPGAVSRLRAARVRP
jgi:hypothetical protein